MDYLHGNIRHVNVYEVTFARLVSELGQSLDKGHTLDVTNSATLAYGLEIWLRGRVSWRV